MKEWQTWRRTINRDKRKLALPIIRRVKLKRMKAKEERVQSSSSSSSSSSASPSLPLPPFHSLSHNGCGSEGLLEGWFGASEDRARSNRERRSWRSVKSSLMYSIAGWRRQLSDLTSKTRWTYSFPTRYFRFSVQPDRRFFPQNHHQLLLVCLSLASCQFRWFHLTPAGPPPLIE